MPTAARPGGSCLATRKFAFDLLDGGEIGLEGLGQGLCELVLGDTERARVVPQRVLGDDLVLGLAEDQANRRRVLFVLDLRVDRCHVEAELADVLGAELACFELDDDLGAELEVVEEQVDEEVIASHFQVNLPSDIGEPGAELEEELGDVIDQGLLDLPFAGVLLQAEEVELVGVFE